MTSPKYFYSFNGETFKTEASSKFPHDEVIALGSYRNSPFVTGHNTYYGHGLKTEILNYSLGEWIEADDYPFSNGYMYVSIDFMKDYPNFNNLRIYLLFSKEE